MPSSMANMSLTVLENRSETPMQAMPTSGESVPCNVNAAHAMIMETGSNWLAMPLSRFAATPQRSDLR